MLVAIAGFDGTNALATVEVYQQTADRWTVAATLNTARYGHAAVVVGDRAFVFGGCGAERQPLDSVESIDLNALFAGAGGWQLMREWRLPTPRCDCAALAVDCEIWIIGGAHCCHCAPLLSALRPKLTATPGNCVEPPCISSEWRVAL